ncbi:HNH endonuclease [Cupriavidus necator]|uniref:HNH endonuclease n=1 Tax=Cupriavidus necator TaxID=106590 RepID=A0A367PRU7_CUPNE|nr:HNH endonuclease [Cupriavidus necator]QQX85260.1 HNH endonuclease [Cupriavidus necator]RCJ10274.1 HNH endonuclease [Cupriavidus necator]
MNIEKYEQRWRPLIEKARNAFDGRLERGIKEGFRLEDKNGHQICAIYWGTTNQKGNAIEVAVSPTLGIGKMSGEEVVNWLEGEIRVGRRGSRRRGDKSWPTIGFATDGEVYPFFDKVYDLRTGCSNPTNADAEPSPQQDLLAKYRDKTRNMPETTVAFRRAKQRIGQALLRRLLMDVWGGKCAVIGLSLPRLLRASHIKPWADSTDEERLNPENALLLAPQLDAAFDVGLITFDAVGRLEMSPRVSTEDRRLLGLDSATALRIPPSDEQGAFLAWHREHRFRVD